MIIETDAEAERHIAGDVNGEWRRKQMARQSQVQVPSGRNKLMEILSRVQDDVATSTQQVVETMRAETQAIQTQDYGLQVAGAIQKYALMTSDFIRAIGEQMVNTAESYRSETIALADNITKIAELEAERCREFTSRMREAGMAMKEVKKNFEAAVGRSVNGGHAVTPDLRTIEEQISRAREPDSNV